MKKEKILVITNKDDPHVDGLINLANEQGLGQLIIRLNTEDFFKNCSIEYDTNFGFKLELLDSQKTLYSSEIKTVWYRRPRRVELDTVTNKDIRDFIFEQINPLLTGLYLFCEQSATFMSPIFESKKSSYKVSQLSLAKKMGFCIPHSIITNKYQTVLDFFDKYEKISTKSIDTPNFFYEGITYPMYNRVIKNRDELIKNKNSIELCPTYFQEYIDKQYDIRVIVIGKNVYAFSIDSQSNDFSKEDFRGTAADLMEHKYIELPKELNQLIIKYTTEQKLNFSALDFVLSKNETYYFLENNPNGQWMWLEYATNYPLTQKMLDYLLNPNE
ncbi:RimK-like protein [Bernardetia litoralis DSM 6794]|uniref:RimK-like protein n=1 Tax=Bernardetia litoralis (strain ATCC 23117 / DSM 6794 / NBRC 15988 / NCIMB 1366 / Fx l1 / Sio-4) TaxID=880071 RepID=I4AI67_BERLS|nr:RimK-like protein [Bernardetia litoralis]AFM03652.1 RimK-like protein [Bernardetia litoralis DSM 6794]